MSSPSTTDETAHRIRAARAYAGITQEDMADRLGISIVTYKRIEQAKRDVDLGEVKRISEITGMPIEFFSVDLKALADSETQKAQLEQVQTRIQGLVSRLEDIEFRMRQNQNESGS